MRAIGDIAYDLKKAERLTFGREPCSHTEHNPNCPWCCFKQLAAEYIAYHDQPQAQTATGAHD
ncbi:MAG TPA: hypothetical protein VK479_03160, partial [Micropepsaceae bacterium]|nr:hypothetical protein [Micropepsaceae bacterium]